MQTTQQQIPTPDQAGFEPIPTRIRDVAPLIVEPETVDPQTRSEILTGLGELAQNLAGVHRTTAEAYLSQNEYDAAMPHLKAAAQFAPENIEYWNQLGFVAFLAGDDETAIEAFQTVIGKDARQPDAIYNLGMVLFGKEMHQQAENCFAAYLELTPNDPQGWNNRGVCLHATGRSAEARQCFERSLQIDPQDQDAVFNLQNI